MKAKFTMPKNSGLKAKFTMPKNSGLKAQFNIDQSNTIATKAELNAEIEARIEGDNGLNSRIDEVESTIPDISNLATKTELAQVENEIPDISGLATKAELQEVESTIPDINNLATKTELAQVENEIPDISGLATKSELQTVENKIPNVSNFVNTEELAQDLANYYLKTETYSKQEVNSLIASIPKFTVSIVQALPQTGEPMVLYLVPKDGEISDVYTEYIWIASATKYEQIGSTAVDLEGYATEIYVDNGLAAKQNKINDLSAIREGAELGATALQSGDNISKLVNDKGYVRNTDYATTSTGGVVVKNDSFGINVNSNNGNLSIIQATTAAIDNKTNQYTPITPKVLDYAVKVGVTANTLSLTNAEKTNACNWLGAAPSSSIPTIDTAVSRTSTNAVQNKAIPNYIVSRGENLVTNGFASLGNNYNFNSFTFDGSDTYGAGGCFSVTSTPVGSRSSVISDELMPVDITQSYKLSYAVKNSTSTSTYDFINMYDIDGYVIAKGNADFVQGTTTTLAQELKDGDTKVYLTNISNDWHTGQPGTTSANYYRSLIFWNYTNSYGYTYPVEYYSRNWWFDLWNDDNDVDAVNGVITLKTAWNHGTFPAGTSVSQGAPSGGYVYGNANYIPTAGEWTEKSFIFTPDKFRNGTSYIRLGWLYNYSQRPSNVFKISSISLTQNLSIKDAMTSESYATSSKGGVVKVLSTYGTNINDGFVTTFKASNADIDAKTHQYRPIVPSNLDYAVKKGITSNALTLTDAEKTAAQNWLGLNNEVATNSLKIGNTTLTEAQLQSLLALI